MNVKYSIQMDAYYICDEEGERCSDFFVEKDTAQEFLATAIKLAEAGNCEEGGMENERTTERI
ncbi:hypothetical protein AB685_14920 [Bacillus sp. LL01]|uniref:hypothetical protein n=1 Tax=Bacillus sp. LL01 TaxID=1665556 RepID=UPI00064D59A7|nr:hypothetical protein [Bacillus sp. LL01]KMJ58095.1 hypothetical protein AB685_14920 [Bacillus sp. LL01]